MSSKAVPEMFAQDSNEFVSLEEKVYRTIELLKGAREAKAAAERDLARVREQLETREEELETLKAENINLRRERETVKGRVEKMLQQIDGLIDQSVE